jgi:hypothetical protein
VLDQPVEELPVERLAQRVARVGRASLMLWRAIHFSLWAVGRSCRRMSSYRVFVV